MIWNHAKRVRRASSLPIKATYGKFDANHNYESCRSDNSRPVPMSALGHDRAILRCLLYPES
jgi:hypothetical protein